MRHGEAAAEADAAATRAEAAAERSRAHADAAQAGEARYERYLALGDELGLGEDVVDDMDFNVWTDLAD
ncbi:hypothetical protein [Streptomyces sp. NPDC051310]|uniref:hypothetical protein n=1 Tax=Streptomyces sp. NPDC051310 TaxID=3365649 RepID=UPI00378A5250